MLLIAAVVVGRLAAARPPARGRGREPRRVAAAREREAKLLAEVASAILAGQSVDAQLESIGDRVRRRDRRRRARASCSSRCRRPSRTRSRSRCAPRARQRLAVRRPTTSAGTARELERVAEPLGRLIDVAVERERVAERAAETEAARRADVARTAILHAISHDLRSPLTAITTAGSALRGRGVTDDERAELIEVIEAEGARLAKLVDDLLDLSRIEAGAVAPQADWCDLHDVVASAAAHLRTRAPDRVRAAGTTCRWSAPTPRSSSGCSRT